MATKHSTISGWQESLLPAIVDHLAENTPDSIYAEFPRSATTYAEGFRQITYHDFANAVNGVATWLHDTLGPCNNFEVLAYIGINDVRYTAMVLGAVKAGYTILLLSPRNSIAAQLSLCQSTQCTKLLSPEPKPPAAFNLLKQSDLQDFTIPSLEDLLNVQHPHYPYTKTYQQAKHEPLFIIHTSGSTGIPKPLLYRHESAARNIKMWSINPPEGFTSQDRMFQGNRIVNMMPPFHGAGLVSLLFNSIPFGTVYIAPLPNIIPSAQEVTEMLHHTTAKAALVVPSIVLEFAQSKKLLDFAANRLNLLLYCGGDLPQAVGDIVAQKLLLRCQYGASEIGLTPQLLPKAYNRNDWKYVCFPSWLGFEFRPAADGLSELVVVRDPTLQTTQPTFVLFPDQQEYRSNDLFRPHPSHSNLWAWTARADDIIVFLNGEKTNPISFEQHIVAENEEVSAAIITGSQRFQAALLVECIEALSDTASEAAFIERIWPSVERANKLTPAHARVEKAMILPLDKQRPMIRAGKGTIQRAATLQLLAEDIERIYRSADSISSVDRDDYKRLESLDTVESLAESIREILSDSSLAESENFFSNGMDSLAALGLTKRLRSRLNVPGFSLATIYSNPSVDKLAEAIMSLRKGETETAISDRDKRAKQIKSTLAEFSSRIRSLPRNPSKTKQSQQIFVVLTGSTGTIGSFLLRSLLGAPNIAHVCCLNRRKDARDAYFNYLKSINVLETIDEFRVSFYIADFAQPDLGLTSEKYELIRSNVDVVIHNAWPVNFNLTLNFFRPQLEGIINLIALASQASNPASFLFISSISTILGRQTSTKRIAENLFEDPSPMISNGYAESKWISEMLCECATTEIGLPTIVARVGQIAGPVTTSGVWNRREWLLSLIRSSIELHMLPESIGLSMDNVRWLPVDLLAEIITDLVLDRSVPVTETVVSQTLTSSKVFHLQNPQCTSWSKLLPVVVSSIEVASGRQMRVVPCEEWLSAVRKTMDETMNETAGNLKTQPYAMQRLVERVPAVKLMDFYSRSMSERHSTDELDLTQALNESPTLRNVEAVNDDWMRKWITGWVDCA